MRLILIRGIPGTGKTTLANIISSNVLETDDFFTDSQGVYEFDSKLLPYYHRLNQIRVRQAMNALEEMIVVSNTFAEIKEMKPYIDMANDNNYEVKVISLVGLHPNEHDVPPTLVETLTSIWEPYEGEHIYESAGKTTEKESTACSKN